MSAARIRSAFADAGVTGWLHAVDIDHPDRQVAVGADEAVVLASVFKVPLVHTAFREVDMTATALLRPDHRSAGPTGVGGMLDPVTMSLRDLAYLAITVSDNAAADALVDVVGLDAVNRTMAALGLSNTLVVHRAREVFRTLAEDAGPGDLAPKLADPVVLSRLRALDPRRTNRGTPRDMTTLLSAVWLDPDAAPLRRIMGMQVWPHRLASGFPFDDVRVAGKTGTLPTVRNEIGGGRGHRHGGPAGGAATALSARGLT